MSDPIEFTTIASFGKITLSKHNFSWSEILSPNQLAAASSASNTSLNKNIDGISSPISKERGPTWGVNPFLELMED